MSFMSKLFGRKKEVKKQETNYTSTTTTGTKKDDSDFALSMAVAYATDSTLMGAIVGGDVMGAAVGDMLNSDDNTSHDCGGCDSYDSESSYDSGSFDSGSSYDSGSSSGDW